MVCVCPLERSRDARGSALFPGSRGVLCHQHPRPQSTFLLVLLKGGNFLLQSRRAESHVDPVCLLCQKQFYRESLFDGFLIQETLSFLKLCDIRI